MNAMDKPLFSIAIILQVMSWQEPLGMRDAGKRLTRKSNGALRLGTTVYQLAPPRVHRPVRRAKTPASVRRSSVWTSPRACSGGGVRVPAAGDTGAAGDRLQFMSTNERRGGPDVW
jgi:hypothetical protein